MSELTCTCPHCGQDLNVESDFAGQAVSCPACSGEFAIPEAPHPEPILPPEGTHHPEPILPPPTPHAHAPRLITPGSAPPQPPLQQPPLQPPPQAPYQVPQPPPPGPPVPGGYAPQAQPGQPYPGAPGYFPSGGIGSAFSDPLEGQPRAIQGIGDGKTIAWGIAFCVAWVLAVWLLAWRTGSALGDALAGFGAPGPGMNVKIEPQHGLWLLNAAVPVAVLIGALLSLKAMAEKQVKFAAVLFTSGMAMLPMTLMILFILALTYWEPSGAGSFKAMIHLMVIAMTFALSASILLVKASFSSVLGFSQKAAFWLVPVTILAVYYVSSWIFKLTD